MELSEGRIIIGKESWINEYWIEKGLIGIGPKRPGKNHRNAGKRHKACGPKLRKTSGSAPWNTGTGAWKQAHKQTY